MPLDQVTAKRVRDEAERRGVDPDEAIAEAERIRSSAGAAPAPGKADAVPGKPAPGQHPTFERMLIGAFPFVMVRELRSIWLGLDERIPDDDMMCGEFQAKYGGGAAAAPASPEDE